MPIAHELEAIKRLKYRYLRLLDTKQWDALGALLSDDCSSAYDNGRHAFSGRADMLAFLRRSMSSERLLSKHHVHHPEIDLLDATHAHGVWYLEDTVMDGDSGARVEGTALYFDRYLKCGDEWLIEHTGYQRIWLRTTTLDGTRVLEQRSMFDAAERSRSRERVKPAPERALFAAWD